MKIFKNVAILSLVLLSNLVSAHSGLKNSTPANGAMLNQLPEQVELEFSMPVKLVKLKVIEQPGKLVEVTTAPSKEFKSNFSIELPKLKAGKYKVIWVTMGKDAHKMKGEFTFLIHASDMENMTHTSDMGNMTHTSDMGNMTHTSDMEKTPVSADGHDHQHE